MVLMAQGEKLFFSLLLWDFIDLKGPPEGNRSDRDWAGCEGSPMMALCSGVGGGQPMIFWAVFLTLCTACSRPWSLRSTLPDSASGRSPQRSDRRSAAALCLFLMWVPKNLKMVAFSTRSPFMRREVWSCLFFLKSIISSFVL